jgi:Flp pilus assembly protein TadG
MSHHRYSAVETVAMLDATHSKIAARLRNLMQGRIARRFVRQQDGAAAVEFALVAAPFLALTFAILETAFVFFAGQTLEAAASDSARLIMTGQAQSAGYTAADFKQQVCARIYGLFDCSNGITVNVQTYTSFASVNTASPITNGQFNTANMGYNPGNNPGDITVVQLYYQWPIYVSMFSNKLANLNGGNRLLSATAVFRVEPYK